MKNYKLLIIVFITLINTCYKAQIQDSINSKINSDSTVVYHNLDAIKEPIQDKAYHFSYKKLIIPASLISYGVLTLTSDALEQLNFSTKTEVNEHLPKPSTLDNYTQFLPAAMVYGLNLSGIKGKHNLRDRSIILGTSLLITSAVVTPTKYLVKEERPDQSNNLSFPSGHTAIAFATAQFLFREYQDSNIWIALSGYPIAAFTGIYRMVNNKHWLGDIMAGAGVGILSTELAYWLFPAINSWLQPRSHKNSVTSVYPFYQNKAVGIGLYKSF
ncbi:phosphatase PAP2 family protein [Elizabethkingia meningoseptica]|uniref:phosphatase PAP2 family protein n=1 Tax=Elizabethkingia meningoseptica TaxID=238 RepID=UPI0008A8408F|nr:phosphatase PAP2 family protein [Elizabethkingia meningoseptica]MDE5430185.1 phosphatase PAP2 family protein [Elizabethkingia meningoseptica]MDE5437129.1 phosphatase PAP2 family protein [Elizabethkingia meningoseptica]MDE5447780.1 phosphatase PAP2 family protein [Elizabethkingia meningoseptica]MDE5470019.1 phosphatase PAP2 family protein [Elizabethkingia meningoseptica]MDE5509740.1 phosphatase PAP2 family protein [Elizabethkingia meningoseptica]